MLLPTLTSYLLVPSGQSLTISDPPHSVQTRQIDPRPAAEPGRASALHLSADLLLPDLSGGPDRRARRLGRAPLLHHGRAGRRAARPGAHHHQQRLQGRLRQGPDRRHQQHGVRRPGEGREGYVPGEDS